MTRKVQRLNRIFDKTDGNCHLCHRKLVFSNYGYSGLRGAWHIEHSVPRAKGGSDHLNNLYAACVECNMEKGIRHNKTIRRRNGVSRAPLCRSKKEELRQDNIVSGMVIGGLAGCIGGPVGILVGSVLGGIIGNENSPRK